MKPTKALFNKLKEQEGAVIVLIAVLLIVFLGVAALAIDVGNLYVVRNELQNAADAGALAGARQLFLPNGSLNAGANQVAHDTAILNKSQRVVVEVNEPLTNNDDVQRGHWSFSTRTFTPNSSLAPYTIIGKTNDELDTDTNFVNAVRVRARRQSTQAPSFFSRIFGYSGFGVAAEAVGYIGFAGSLAPGDVDLPFAICIQAIVDENGDYQPSVGRWINNSGSPGQNTGSETGGWTDFKQSTNQPQGYNPCQGGANRNTVGDAVNGNPYIVTLGQDMAVMNGQVSAALSQLRNRWISETNKTTPWPVSLPVVECAGNNFGTTCEKLIGAVNVNILWITDSGVGQYKKDLPQTMGDWAAPANTTDPDTIFNDFSQYFNLRDIDGTLASIDQASIYFQTSSVMYDPIGTTGGTNFGVLARIPVLVD